MKIVNIKQALPLIAAFAFASCGTDVDHDIPAVDAPALVSTTPENGASNVKAGEITIEVEYDKNIFFAKDNLGEIRFTGGELVSADVLGAGNILAVKVNVTKRGAACSLSIPEGIVTGPNRAPAPAVSIQFSTLALDGTPVAATSAKAVKLFNYLVDNFEVKTLSAMMANVAWNTEMSERVYGWTGKYPAINCFDYIHLPFSLAGAGWIDYGDITPVKDWADNGGIVAAMWHWNVPKKDPSSAPGVVPDYAFYKAETEFDAANATVEGTWENKVFVEDLKNVAACLKLLRDADIPVLWRPFHEAAGGWFWWGKDAASYKALWAAMFNCFKEAGLDNLIWVWTAETGDADWYPGDQYVDIVGRDIYNKGTADCVAEYNSVAGAYGNKIVSLSECGTVGLISDEAWWKDAMSQEFVISREDLPPME